MSRTPATRAPNRHGPFLPVKILMPLIALAFLAGPADAGFLIPAGSVTKSVTSFQHAGEKITVWRYLPKAKGKHPTLVFLYGMDCLAESPVRYEFVAQRFAAKGYAVNFVHYFDCGRVASKGVGMLQERLKACLIASGPAANDAEVRKHFQSWVGTVKAAVRFTRGLPDVDPERVCLVGFSLGGFVAMSLLATEPDLGLAAVVECFGGLPRELRGELRKAPPVLIFHGDQDDVVPVQEAHALRSLLQEKRCRVESHIFPGCGHMWLDDRGNVRFDRILAAETICLQFLDRNLKNGAPKRR